jgi:hypothetical protein
VIWAYWRRIVIGAVACALLTALIVTAGYAVSHHQAPQHQSEAPLTNPAGTSSVPAAPPTATPMDRTVAQNVAQNFGLAYFSGSSFSSYLTPQESPVRALQGERPSARVGQVIATYEAVAPDGSLMFMVDASVNGQEQAVEVYVAELGGRYLIEQVNQGAS